MNLKKWLLAAPLALACAWANADTYPSHTITMVVPFNAGGPTDTVARVLAQALSKQLGASVVVENIGGAGGTLGAEHIAKTTPDGYTLLLHHIGLATAQTLYRKLPYDTRTAFSPIGLVTEAPMALMVRPGLPVHSLPDLVALMKQKPGALTFGHSGLGGADQLCGLLLQTAVGSSLQLVPYRGNAPVMTDMLGGRIDMTCGQLTNATGYIKSGQVRGLAVTAAARSPVLPDLPITREAGLPQLDITVWHGLFAPAGTPAPVIDRLAAALRGAMADPQLSQRFLDIGTTPVSAALASPAALKQRLDSEIDRWAPIIQAAGQYAD
ncbi:MAG TPA: tripartite tricarboxylate transporter substrate binding protein [Bordetella sp.]